MPRRRLTDEEISKIANKEWKAKTIFTSDERRAYQAKNLTGPKTLEGKMRSLKNLEVGRNSMDNRVPFKHGGYVKKILNEEEQELYFSRREDYLADYDINGSADEMMLHTVLMEEVIYYRLMRAQALKPSMDIDRPLNDCTRRLRQALEDLGALRNQRLKQDDKQNALSIASVAQAFFREIASGGVQKLLEQQAEEEKAFLEQKRKREAEKEIEAEYRVIEEDDENAK